MNIHWKDWFWSWNAIILVTWCEELTHWKRPWCWERVRAGEGDDRGWNGWMTSPTWWTWIWTNSGSWCWTGRPGMLQSMRSQRVGYDWATELNHSIFGISLGNIYFTLNSVSFHFGKLIWSLECCSPWSRKELDTTEQLNWTDIYTLHPTVTSLKCKRI